MASNDVEDPDNNTSTVTNNDSRGHTTHIGDSLSGSGSVKARDVNHLTTISANYFVVGKQDLSVSAEQDKNKIDNDQLLKSLKNFLHTYQKECYFLDVEETSCDDIRKIFPEMVQVPFLEEDVVTTKEQYLPTQKDTQTLHAKQTAEKVTFQEILDKMEEGKFVNLIGLPGQGKSTFCKRASRYFCNGSTSLCIVIEFRKLNFDPPDYKLTLKELLVDNVFVNLKSEECDRAFQWIRDNDKNLLLIFDGYDQVSWFTEGAEKLPENATQFHFNKPRPVWELISNLVNKVFLPNSRIIFTSRPHATKSLPKHLRKKFTVELLDLSSKNIQKLIDLFSGSEATDLLNNLDTEAPQLVSLCGSPLMLQLVIMACAGSTSNIASIKTMTRLFAAVFELLNDTGHAGKCEDIRDVLPSLSKLAFNATTSKTVMMTKKDITGVDLDVNAISHLIISQQTGRSFHLVEGEKEIFYFIHQTFQEYLTALYIAKYMPEEMFTQFVDKDLFSSHWIVVGQFLFGIVFDKTLK